MGEGPRLGRDPRGRPPFRVAPRVEWAPSPNFDVSGIHVTDIVIHATDSGLDRNPMNEYASSMVYLRNPQPHDPSTGQPNPDLAVSAHSVAGPGVVARLVSPDDRAWHVRWWNGRALGLELARGKLGQPVADAVLNAGAWEAANWAQAFDIPLVWDQTPGFWEHRDTPPGIEDGKQDVDAHAFDRADFLRRVGAWLALL